MSSIRVLPAEIAGRIAAGEVIERPASVVKELVENAIDARATRIRVQIEQGGHRLIQVTDNGCGMDRQDALLCLEAHATSKMSQDGDVGQIMTLGFRGEAIPSIASVSHFQLQTRRAEDDIGTEIIVEHGIIRDVNDCGCAPGTNIRVGHLFGNLPARRKFLKGPDTEDGHIEEMILMLALARPDIAFSLALNGKDVLRAPATTDLAARARMLLGREAFDAMLPVEYDEDGIAVRGFISRPGYTRASRHEQRMIINGRAAAAETLYFAIREAYDTLILKGRYPAALLYVTMAPDRVDVNVHPAKREVRFRDPRQVGAIVAAAVRRALRRIHGDIQLETKPFEHLQPHPFESKPVQQELPAMDSTALDNGPQRAAELPLQPPKDRELPETLQSPALPILPPPMPLAAFDNKGVKAPLTPPAAPTSPCIPESSARPSPRVEQPPLQSAPPCVEQTPLQSAPPRVASALGEFGRPVVLSLNGVQKPCVDASKGLMLSIRGRLGKQYVLAEGRDGLAVIDIRAAHQRILFERLLGNLKNQKVLRQQLLLPVTVNVSPLDARLMSSQLGAFDSLGFTVEPFGGTTFLLTAVPAGFPNQDLNKTVLDILEDLRQDRTARVPNALHLAQTACRHAVSLKEGMTDEEIRLLLTELLSAEMPYADPMGNPTMVHVTYAELQKRFGH